ncbi:MAG: PAS domain S-box protein [Trichocoleus desertorum ATA4-8-CV12]|jgi:PAS domain S-box-containing protein|nr:PAS domain S-box protein [Trichocoleus desertorum ATA4-8-CV12]
MTARYTVSQRYGIATFTVAIALVLTCLLQPLLTYTPALMFFVAVVLNTWYSGAGTGFWAAFLSALAFEFFIAPPRFELVVDEIDLLRLGAWIATVVGTNSLHHTLWVARRQAHVRGLRLWENREKLSLAIEAAQIGTWEWDIWTGKVSWSRQHERLFGLSADAFPGTVSAFLACVHPEDRERVAQSLELVQASRTDYSQEFRIIWPDGTVHWIVGQGRFLQDEISQPIRMLGTVLDVTERKQAEEVLRQSHDQLERLVEERTLALTQANVILQQEIAERQQAQEALYRREQESKALLDNTPDVIIRCDRAFRYVYVNPAVERITGLPATFFLGRTSHQQGLPESLCQTWDATMQRMFITGQEQTVEFEAPSCQGCRSYQSRVVPELDAEGNVQYALIVSRDVTALKQAEAERWQLIQEQAARAEAEAAQRRDAFLAKMSAQLAASFEYETTLQQVAELIVPELADYCIIYSHEEGTDLIQRVAAAHIDPGQAEQLLAMNQAYPLYLQSEIPVAEVIRTGQATYQTDVADTFFRQLPASSAHITAIETLATQSYLIQPLLARDRILGAILLATTVSERRYGLEDFGLVAEAAHRAAIAIDNVRLYQKAQQARAASEAARRTAEAANRMKDEFLATLSHELRTPLNSILGWSRLLTNRQMDAATTTRALETIERNAKLQAQLIEDILDVSRIICGKLRLNLCPTKLETVIQAAIDAVRPAAEAKSLHLSYCCTPALERVLVDPDRMQQVVWNLLSNAVKFTPAGGRVEVQMLQVEQQPMPGNLPQSGLAEEMLAAPAGSYAEIRVSDTGVGIVPEFLPHVFDRFRQADSTTTRSQGGLGLGLAIMRHLVELHGGTVHVTSPGEGQGATFMVRLPLMKRPDTTQPESAQQLDAIATGSEPALEGMQVLLLDDEVDIRELFTVVLEAQGAKVTAVAAVDEALNALQHCQPDVLVSDIAMPERDGYEFIQQVRANPHMGNIPAIALTAYAREEDQQRSLAAGFQMHLSKPVEPTTLTRAIASLVRSSHRIRPPL